MAWKSDEKSRMAGRRGDQIFFEYLWIASAEPGSCHFLPSIPPRIVKWFLEFWEFFFHLWPDKLEKRKAALHFSPLIHLRLYIKPTTAQIQELTAFTQISLATMSAYYIFFRPLEKCLRFSLILNTH
jgi:hypothetical protein